MHTRRWIALSLLLAMLATLGAGPVSAAGDPYAADPHRLVPFIDTVQQVYTKGTDVWQVWVCRVPGWSPVLDPASVTTELERVIAPYFAWLSEGAYTPAFRAGGVVTSNDVVSGQPATPEAIFAPGCETAVAAAAGGAPNGALIVVDAAIDAGYATAGAVCPEAPYSGCRSTYPENARRVVLGASTVTAQAPFGSPQWITVAHEIGHALNWAHSYGGLTIDPVTGAVDRYDNPMDLMSGGAVTGLPIGAIAYDRYAAGWIRPEEVRVHTSGVAQYDIAGIGGTGIRLVVLPGSSEGNFFVLGARRRTSYDVALPKAGVEVYEIDQRRELACGIPEQWPQTWPCFATFIRIAQAPAVAGETGPAHVLGIDEERRFGSFTISVIAAGTSSFTVRVAEGGTGTFIDDDGSPHEADIEAIARLGITKGCNPPTNNRFCPADPVTRAQMAVFLVQALGLGGTLSSRTVGYFSDVPAGAWYTPYVERLFELGITKGYPDGTYRPDAVVNRGEMAGFLVAAFDHAAQISGYRGLFADVPESAWYATRSELIFSLGITSGCELNPLRYCPTSPVRRDQMATFLARALESAG
jgi:hypothetical protein